MKAQRASATAKVIAASTILLASDPRTAAEIPPAATAMCARMLGGSWSDRLLARSAAFPVTRSLWRCLEKFTLPGIVVHYARRKRWIESRCRAAVAQGCARLIVIGAGFDTLGNRLALEFADLCVIEIDHPATQAAKRRALAGGNAAAAANVHYIACDLSADPLPAHLAGDGTATVVVMEGVLMYLQPAAIARLFRSLHALAAARMHVIFTFMTKWPDGTSGFRPRSWLIERWLAWRGEPFAWAIEPAAIGNFVSALKFKLTALALTRELNASQTPASMLDGENLVMCERA